MLLDDISDFINPDDFAIVIRFTSDDDFADLTGIFDKQGTEIGGLVLDSARFLSRESNVDRGWTCAIFEDDYEVVYVTTGNGNYSEYFLRNITDADERNIA